jgi:hypothetical protein
MKIEAPVLYGGRDEEVEIHGKSDCRNLGRALSAAAGRRGLQEARYSQCLALPVEEQVLGRIGQRAQSGSVAGSRNSRLKKMYAELALKNTAITDVLSR